LFIDHKKKPTVTFFVTAGYLLDWASRNAAASLVRAIDIAYYKSDWESLLQLLEQANRALTKIYRDVVFKAVIIVKCVVSKAPVLH